VLEGHLRVKEVLTLPGEDWSLPGKRPRNSNDNGKCQGGPEGENY